MRSALMRFAQRFFLGVGFVTLAYAGRTVAYVELYQQYQFWMFDRQIGTIELTKTAADERLRNQSRQGATINRAESVDLSEGDVIGKLEIPQIGISVMVLQGVKAKTLRAGAGHVPGTPLPGADGNSAIAAHRDTYRLRIGSSFMHTHPSDSLRRRQGRTSNLAFRRRLAKRSA